MRDVKLEMVRLGIRQVEMAHKLKINDSLLNKILNGWRQPEPELERRIRSFVEKRKNQLRRQLKQGKTV